jgi:hypothetical protein
MARPETPIWLLLIPSAVLGFGNAFMWGPLASITTFGLSQQLAGAGSGVYNTSRQVGAVLGSAAMAAFMGSRIAAKLGPEVADAAGGAGAEGGGGSGALPAALHDGFAAAMGESILMPMGVIVVGALIALLFAPRPARTGGVRLPVER